LALAERPFDPRASVAGTLFAEALPRFVVALGRADSRAAERARAEATGDAAQAALGQKAAANLMSVLSAADALAAAKSAEQAHVARDGFVAAAASLNRNLAARDLPYFLDSDALLQSGRVAPLLTTYYVEREAVVTTGRMEVRAVHLWRLDNLKLREGYLGYTRPSTPAALVLLDQIESDLVRYVLPALPRGEVMLLVDQQTELAAPEWAVRLALHAASVVRRHYAMLPDDGLAELQHVAELLARRRALVRRWRTSIAELGHRLRIPERLSPEAEFAGELELRVPPAELREWNELHEQLLEPESVAAFERVRDRYVASVERHEVQHRIDYARGLIPVPPVLADRLGVENPLDAPQTTLAGRARDELSAYLAAIGSAEHSPLLDLVLLSRFLFDEGNLGGPYSYAALAAYEGIAQELGIEAGALIGDGPLERPRVAQLFERITTCSAEELRAAAARFYARCFGQPVPTVQRQREIVRAPWRH
jgi:hypothetical protein